MELSADEEAEIQEALRDWFPANRCPVSPKDWDKLVDQKARFAGSACESYDRAVESDAPRFLRQMLAKSRWRLVRTYLRTKRAAEHEKLRLANNLLPAIFHSDD